MLSTQLSEGSTNAELNRLLKFLRNPTAFFKTWGTAIEEKAKANARAKGGRTIWPNIAGATRLHSVSSSGAVVECFDRIGAHKEFGGPIRAKNRRFLTIPVDQMAVGHTVGELQSRGVAVFRPAGRKVLGTNEGNGANRRFRALYALCAATRPQRAEPWWPTEQWALQEGVRQAEKHLAMR